MRYPYATARLLQADCVIRGDDLDADMDVLRKSDASCEVAFADYLLPGETVRALKRGPSGIIPPSFSFTWRIPIKVTNSSNE